MQVRTLAWMEVHTAGSLVLLLEVARLLGEPGLAPGQPLPALLAANACR